MDVKELEPAPGLDIAWCPGCGNFGIRKALMQVLAEMNVDLSKLVLVSGIGQAAKLTHYVNANVFNGLHGRAIPPATAIKASNPELLVIVESGDGDMYGEGGNHFMHAIRRNPDITCFVHDNMVYGLTKGQASPTSQEGFKTAMQPAGVILEPFNPLAVSIALDAPFVARAYIGDMDQTREIMKKAISHKGFALVDIFQPCVTFNKLNTFQWFKEHTYYLEEGYDPHDRTHAFQRALEKDKLPLGVFYIAPERPTFEEHQSVYQRGREPLWQRRCKHDAMEKLLEAKLGNPPLVLRQR
ncbi:MAG: thiamine pyrophosphate-dependent enzyme [Candidatus Latescibacterota bacterium]